MERHQVIISLRMLPKSLTMRLEGTYAIYSLFYAKKRSEAVEICGRLSELSVEEEKTNVVEPTITQNLDQIVSTKPDYQTPEKKAKAVEV